MDINVSLHMVNMNFYTKNLRTKNTNLRFASNSLRNYSAHTATAACSSTRTEVSKKCTATITSTKFKFCCTVIPFTFRNPAKIPLCSPLWRSQMTCWRGCSHDWRCSSRSLGTWTSSSPGVIALPVAHSLKIVMTPRLLLALKDVTIIRWNTSHLITKRMKGTSIR